MHITLTLIDNGKAVIIESDVDGEAVIGRRDLQTGVFPQIDLHAMNGKDKGISRRHAALISNNEIVNLVDLRSRNGTRVNGILLHPFQPRALRSGDLIGLGRALIRVRF